MAPKARFIEVIPPSIVPFDTAPGVRASVQRISGTDIETYSSWLVPMLQEDTGASPATIGRWMRAWACDNQFSFVGTKNAVGLAMLTQWPMMPAPVVQEIFMSCRSGEFKNEGIEIYLHFNRWKELSGASEFRFHASIGAPMPELKAAFPNIQYQKMWTT